MENKMRVTNNMMLKTTMSNINGNKQNVNTLNNQMTSQKKIARPSDDPVIAIRSLRFRSSLSEINQYYEKNIPDAESWLDVTETALTNMESILSDIRTQCTYAATGTLTVDDRDAILKSLTQLRDQLYAEGNTDYAGRTVFTGYRTNSKLTFDTDENDTSYDITQTFDKTAIEKEHRYYKGNAVVPSTEDLAAGSNAKPTELERTECDRIRFAYDDMKLNITTDADHIVQADNQGNIPIKYTNAAGNEYNLNEMVVQGGQNVVVKKFETLDAWKESVSNENFPNAVADNEVVIIENTGEMLLGKEVTEAIEANNYKISIDYSKEGFSKGELRPEFYFNCTDTTSDNVTEHITYEKFDANGNEIRQDINYTIAHNQNLTVNTNASDVFNADAGRDVDEMMDAVQYAIQAHDKVGKIEKLMSLEEYSSAEKQEELQGWLEAAEKEADYADDNLKKLFNTYIGKFDSYLTDVNLAITTVGSKGEQLELTETRMSNQQLTIGELKSSNEDKELSDIIIEYTSAYTAYEASLQAASKINKNTLLNYI